MTTYLDTAALYELDDNPRGRFTIGALASLGINTAALAAFAFMPHAAPDNRPYTGITPPINITFAPLEKEKELTPKVTPPAPPVRRSVTRPIVRPIKTAAVTKPTPSRTIAKPTARPAALPEASRTAALPATSRPAPNAPTALPLAGAPTRVADLRAAATTRTVTIPTAEGTVTPTTPQRNLAPAFTPVSELIGSGPVTPRMALAERESGQGVSKAVRSSATETSYTSASRGVLTAIGNTGTSGRTVDFATGTPETTLTGAPALRRGPAVASGGLAADFGPRGGSGSGPLEERSGTGLPGGSSGIAARAGATQIASGGSGPHAAGLGLAGHGGHGTSTSGSVDGVRLSGPASTHSGTAPQAGGLVGAGRMGVGSVAERGGSEDISGGGGAQDRARSSLATTGEGSGPQLVTSRTKPSSSGKTPETSSKGLETRVETPQNGTNERPTPDHPTGTVVASSSRGGKTPGKTQDCEEVFSPNVSLPADLKKRSFNGAVRIRVTVDVDGSHEEELVEGSGDSDIDEQILRTLRRWKWRPALKDGEKVKSSKTFRYRIRIGD